MATTTGKEIPGANAPPNQGPTPPQTPQPSAVEFRGHPQPSINERLENAKIFLADEDPNRDLNFATRITEVEEYAKLIEGLKGEDDLNFDRPLLKDVQTMLQVHRKWEERMDAGPTDTMCVSHALIQPYSTRLVSTETAIDLVEAKAAMGLTYQTREDHAPFTVEREPDHRLFFQKLNDDAATNPILVDEDTNLLYVESRAYQWALREPSMIPQWMHPTHGIPKRAPRMDEPPPWYRAPEQPSEAVKKRPARGWLPNYLVDLEAEINKLLKKANRSQKEWEELEQLLRIVEDHQIRPLHEKMDKLLRAERRGYLGDRATELMQAIDEFATVQAQWIEKFQSDGVYFIVKSSGDKKEEVDFPGVFYIHGTFTTPEHDTIDARANSLLSDWQVGGWSALNVGDTCLLRNLMNLACPQELAELREEREHNLITSGANRYEDLYGSFRVTDTALATQIDRQRDEWEAKITSNGANFIYLRPGERRTSDESLLYLPWTLVELPTLQPVNRGDLLLSNPLSQLQTRIRDLVRLDNRTDADIFIRENLLAHVAHPILRVFLIPWVILRRKREQKIRLKPYEREALAATATLIKQFVKSWKAGLKEDVRIKLTRPEHDLRPQLPWVLYWRGSSQELSDLKFDSLEEFSLQLNSVRTAARGGDARAVIELRELMEALAFPRFRGLMEHPNATANARSHMYERWINSLEAYPRLEIRKFNGYLDQDDDPNVVYYNGPLPQTGDSAFSAPKFVDDYLQNFQTNQPLPTPDGTPANVRSAMSRETQLALTAYGYATDIGQEPPSRSVLQWYYQTIIRPYGDSAPSVPPLISPYLEIYGRLTVTLPQTGASQSSMALVIRSRTGRQQTRTRPQSPTRNTSLASTNINDTFSGLSTPPITPAGRETGPQEYTPLGVDLNVISTQIDRLRVEIIRLLNDYRTSGTTWTEANFRRLWRLLDQFLPENVQLAEVNCIAFSQQRAKSPAEYHRLLEEARAQRMEWLTKTLLPARSIRIQTSNSPALVDETTLVFNPDKTNKAQECRISAPTLATSADGQEANIEHYDPLAALNNTPLLDNTQQGHVQSLLANQNGINALLSKRKPPGVALTWEESDLLLEKIRVIMPHDLSNLDTELRTEDAQARTRDLTDEEEARFWELLEAWQTQYNAWLDFLEPPISIASDSRDVDIDHKKLLRVRITDFQSLGSVTHARDLPFPVRKIRDRARYLLAPTRQLTDDEMIELDILLRPIWRRIGRGLRREVQQRLAWTLGSQAAGPDFGILVENVLAEAYSLYLRKAKTSATSTLDIGERVPGYYRLELGGGAAISGATDPIADTVAEAFRVFCPPSLNDSLKRLLDLAKRLRDKTLSVGEISSLNFSQHPKAKELELYAQASQLAETLDTNPQADSVRNDLIAARDGLFWYRWAYSNPALAKEIQDTVEASRTSMLPSQHNNRINAFENNVTSILIDELAPMLSLAGTRQQPDPPAIPPPSDLEISEVQTEVNNLLQQGRAGSTTSVNSMELDYLLLGLLGPHLKHLHDQVVTLDRQFVVQAGLNTNKSMTYSMTVKVFLVKFERWKQRLPRYGMLLDRWWFSSAAIEEICSRARLWKAANERNPLSAPYPATGTELLSTDMKEWKGIYQSLLKFMKGNCAEDESLKEILLLWHLDTSIESVPQRIRDDVATLRAIEAAGNTNENLASVIRTQQEHFVQAYMNWYTGLTPTQLAGLKQKASATYAGTMDFTPKAERRGIQRAAIELALNTLATNQEQHRLNDRFRILDLPPVYQPLPQAQEVPLSLPLEPTKRPLEQDPLDYTKKLLAFREWKDFDFELARERQLKHAKRVISPPMNYNGPFVLNNSASIKIAAQAILRTLTGISKILHDAYQTAPRPVLARMLERIQEALSCGRNIALIRQSLIRADGADGELTVDTLELFRLVAEPSWACYERPFPDHIDGITNVPREWEQFNEFYDDFKSYVPVDGRDEIPFWGMGAWHTTTYDQDLWGHDSPSAFVMPFNVLAFNINLHRQRRYGTNVPLWALADAERYLNVLVNANRIHRNTLIDPVTGEPLPNPEGYARIPLDGHPENRFLQERGDLIRSRWVYTVNANNQYDVQYDHHGTRGPPILQPNKYHHLEYNCWRLGRDIVYLLNAIAYGTEDSPSWYSYHQYREYAETLPGMDQITHTDRGQRKRPKVDPRTITMKKLALELLLVAPDLADDAGFDFQGDPETNMTDHEAGMLLQMEILEEANNAWEFKFPEKEHVWEFSNPRVEPREVNYRGKKIMIEQRITQYFSMRRHPFGCQSQTVKDYIKTTGPEVQEKPKPPVMEKWKPGILLGPGTSTKEQPEKFERHIQGREPNFPFGETPYQTAFQDYKLQIQLAGIKEFEPQTQPKRSFFSLGKRARSTSPPPIDRYALPIIPPTWAPTSVSLAEKRLAVIADAKKLAHRDHSFPDPNLLEAWHTSEEITEIKRREAYNRRMTDVRAGHKAVEGFLGKKWDDLTRDEIRNAQLQLNIDTFTGTISLNPAGVMAGNLGVTRR